MTDVELFFIDLPKVHEFAEESNNFFRVIADTENLELFDIPLVQQEINFKWDIIKNKYIWNNFLPSVIQLIASMVYVIFLFHDRIYQTLGDYWVISNIIEQLQVTIAFFILYQEYKQLKDAESLSEYFFDFWNINDLLPPLIIISLAFLSLARMFENMKENHTWLSVYAISFSIAILCMWFKILHFMRIFDATNFLVRAIITCISDVVIFLGIFLVILTGVGSANLVV